MKIQCDVCKGEEASVFCCADEAALCDGCDRRVHRANKLAGKHRRFSLIHPSSPHHSPLCDVCQEKRAFLFCQEDRAILCRDCDFPIHNANDLTRKHNRFLLTGIKLSPAATPAAESDCPASAAISSSTSEELPEDVSNQDHSKKSSPFTVVPAADEANDKNRATPTGGGGGGGSSISEYLIKELPGWHVEDLLLESSSSSSLSAAAHNSAAIFGFSKMGEDLMPFLEVDLDGGGGGGFAAAEDDGNNLPMWWVPQVPQVSPPNPAPPPPPLHHLSYHPGFGMGVGLGGELTKVVTRQQQQQLLQQQRLMGSDDGFMVPEITIVHHHHHQPSSNKRSRPSSR